MVQYRDQLMPLVQWRASTSRPPARSDPGVRRDKRSMGLVVDEIIDIVEERLNIEVAAPATASGSAVIKGQATEVIDVGPLPPMAFAELVHPQGDDPLVELAIGAPGETNSAILPQLLAPVLKAAATRCA